MNKQQLINEIAKKNNISKAQAGRCWGSAIDAIKSCLKNGQRVQLVGFGTFLVRARKARQGRNPKTGETIQIKARKVPAFTAGSELKNIVR